MKTCIVTRSLISYSDLPKAYTPAADRCTPYGGSPSSPLPRGCCS
jgi:hypothetical protein